MTNKIEKIMKSTKSKKLTKTTVSLPEEAYEKILRCSQILKVSPRQFSLLCLKVFLYLNPYPDNSQRATVEYNSEPVSEIFMIKLSKEEHDCVHSYRYIAKISVSYLMSVAVKDFAERLTYLLLKKGKLLSFRRLVQFFQVAVCHLRFCHRRLAFRHDGIVGYHIVIPGITSRALKKRQFSSKILQNKTFYLTKPRF